MSQPTSPAFAPRQTRKPGSPRYGGPVFAVGWRAFVHCPSGKNAFVPLNDEEGTSVVGKLKDGEPVEILGWVPRGSATRYHVKSTKDRGVGWLGAASLRSTVEAVPEPVAAPSAAEIPAPEPAVAPRAAFSAPRAVPTAAKPVASPRAVPAAAKPVAPPRRVPAAVKPAGVARPVSIAAKPIPSPRAVPTAAKPVAAAKPPKPTSRTRQTRS